MPERSLPVAGGRDVARWLWTALKGRRLRIVGIFGLFLVEAALALVFPLVLGALVDDLGRGQGGVPEVFWWQVAALTGAAVASGGVAWAGGVALARVAETTIAELREAYVTAALDLPRSTVEAVGTGDVVTRASDDIAQISETLPDVVPKLAISCFTIALVAAGLGSLNPWFLAGFALTVPVYALTVRWYLRTAPEVYQADRAAQSVRGQRILGALAQLPTVVAYGRERPVLSQIDAATWETVRWSMRGRIVQNRLFGRLNVAEALGLFAVLGIGVWLASTRAVTPGDATAAALLFLRTMGPISALLFVMDDLQSALAALGRVVGVIGAAPRGGGAEDIDEAPSGSATPVDGVAVAVDDVHHAYRPGVPVLEEVSLELGRGEVVAVVGATGSGKTTLASLIAGVHRPSRGRIDVRVPERAVMTVTQETHVFAGTLRENLTIARPEVDDARLVEALRATHAENWVGALPDGVDTVVGHGGHALTAAQAQQLALARLLLADPEVVLLDEATAEAGSADTGTLDAAAAAVIRGRTALVIAHRLSQAEAADRVVVLEAGRIVESGPHADLVAAGGHYAALWEAWSGPGRALHR
ncbi:MAG: ABC transporter ATP-binding protein [Arachnia sp.]